METMATDSNHPTVSSYADAADLPLGAIVRVSADSKDIPNAGDYELFKVVPRRGERWIEPLRGGIIADYSAFGLGYLIQETALGYRYIALEPGEEDTFGNYLLSPAEAARAALAHWGTFGGDRLAWVNELTVAAGGTDPSDKLSKIEGILRGHPAARELSPIKISALAYDLAKAL